MILTLKEAKERGLVESLKKRCDEMDLGIRTRKNLAAEDATANVTITFIWELVQLTMEEFLDRENVGRKTFNYLRELLSEIQLEFNTQLTDALKREIGAPIMADDPHEDWEPTSGTAAPPNSSPMLDELQQKLDAANATIEQTQRKISEAKEELTALEDRKRSLEFAIKHFTTIALALS